MFLTCVTVRESREQSQALPVDTCRHFSIVVVVVEASSKIVVEVVVVAAAAVEALV